MLEEKKQSESVIHTSNNISTLFDDALPESLLHKGIHHQTDDQPQVRIGEDHLSPYIIHLKREAQASAVYSDPIAELEQHLLTSPELLLEEESDESDALEVSIDLLHDQLRELDRVAAVSAPQPAKSTYRKPEELSQAPLSDYVPLSLDVPETDEPTIIEESTEVTHIETVLPEHQEKTKLISFTLFSHLHTRAVASFVALSLLLVAPIHAMQGIGDLPRIEEQTTAASLGAISNIQSAADAVSDADFALATADFSRAESAFADAQSHIDELGSGIALIANVIPRTNRTYQSATGLVEAGQSLSKAAALFAQAGDDLSGRETLTVTTKLALLETYLEQIQPELNQAATALKRVRPEIIPAEYQEQIATIQTRVPQAATATNEFLLRSRALRTMLGDQQDMRYLVAFQNHTELRATGGFIGSYAQIDFSEGAIRKLSIPEGGSYGMQGQLSAYVEAPEPLHIINRRWEFQDANWFPDFTLSARKMIDFYEAAGGPTVDGVIAVNASVLPDILAITGPIELPEYHTTVSAENVLFEMRKIIDQTNDEYIATEGTSPAPKGIIGALTPVLLDRITELEMQDFLLVADLLIDQLQESEIQMYFTSDELQRTARELGWTGEQIQAPKDYLQVVNTNIGGGKTDTVIDQNIQMQVAVGEDGSIVNTVYVTKTHRGLPTATLEGVNNVDYMRLYVPEGAELLRAEGFERPSEEAIESYDAPLQTDEDLDLIAADRTRDEESLTDIWNENGKTVFGNWVQTKPGETETAVFVYKLPFTLETTSKGQFMNQMKQRLGLLQLTDYSIVLQRQSGVQNRDVHVQVILPSNKRMLWSSHGENGAFDIKDNQNTFAHFLIESL